MWWGLLKLLYSPAEEMTLKEPKDAVKQLDPLTSGLNMSPKGAEDILLQVKCITFPSLLYEGRNQTGETRCMSRCVTRPSTPLCSVWHSIWNPEMSQTQWHYGVSKGITAGVVCPTLHLRMRVNPWRRHLQFSLWIDNKSGICVSSHVLWGCSTEWIPLHWRL